MKVFIDLGAYYGDSVNEFNNWIQLIDEPSEFEIWAFEPNPDLKEQNIINAKDNNYHFKPWAATDYDGITELAVDKTATPMGSTIMKSKKSIWNRFPHIQVKAFDFSKWLGQKFDHSDTIIVKMDIEGAEYPVLKKMLADGTINYPSYLFVEFHPNKVNDYTTDDTNELVNQIIEAGGNIKLWH